MILTSSMKSHANCQLEKWAVALETGDYKRTTLSLKDYFNGNLAFCCLGVLGEINREFFCYKRVWSSNYFELHFDFSDSCSTVQIPFVHWKEFFFFPSTIQDVDRKEEAVKFALSYGVTEKGISYGIQSILMSLNEDSKVSFKDIAEFVRLLKYEI